MPADPPPAAAGGPPAPPRIVALGASAGGLGALQRFFGAVQPGAGLAYVVVQHMDPTHPAMLSVLLQRQAALPVDEVTDGMLVEPERVYVIPPNAELTVARGRLVLGPASEPHGRRLPIDRLFVSLAEDQGARAIGVVLSGMGADGTLGAQAIQRAGGLVLAQEPGSAQFDAMPRSVIAAQAAAIVALPEDMPAHIRQAVPPAVPSAHAGDPAAAPDVASPVTADVLATIVRMLHQHCKHDFSLYKVSTLRRRVERRVAVHHLASMADYARFLQTNPQELDLLFAEVLIGVTAFFRDAEVWQDLRDRALPDLLAQAAGGQTLRAWVVGCSTGQEAYSLAMAFCEAIDRLPIDRRPMLQVFATDLSDEALAVARRGLYPASAAEELSPARLARFFSAQAGGLRINKALRDMVLFARHDVTRDPPFTRLDLLACRNLLIYFRADLQQRLMPLFHYSLRPGGVLLLGNSETVGRSRHLFTPLAAKSRLYVRTPQVLGFGAVDFPVHRPPAASLAAQESTVLTPSTHLPNLQSLADHVLLQEFAPAAVLVNEAGDILYVSGHTGAYLEPAAGKANWNLHVMARPGLRTQLAVALRQAHQEQGQVDLTGLRVDEASPFALHVSVRALREPRELRGMLMVVFREVPASRARRRAAGAAAAGAPDAALREELARSREEIHALRAEMQASSDALQAANEALQSTNEELQSANEELMTSKEEAQSMNEELQTINSELQIRLDDLALAQSDMQNLLNSTDIATLFLDNDLNVRRYTDRAAGLFHVRESDIGRPLSDLASTLRYPDLHAHAKETLRTLVSNLAEVPTDDGRWFSVRILPYRTVSNMIQGLVLTFVDTTVAKKLELKLREGYSEP